MCDACTTVDDSGVVCAPCRTDRAVSTRKSALELLALPLGVLLLAGSAGFLLDRTAGLSRSTSDLDIAGDLASARAILDTDPCDGEAEARVLQEDFAHGDHAGLMARSSDWLHRCNAHTSVLDICVRSLLATENLDEATRQADWVTREFPANSDSYVLRARVHQEKGDRSAEIADLRTALMLTPSDARSLRRLVDLTESDPHPCWLLTMVANAEEGMFPRTPSEIRAVESLKGRCTDMEATGMVRQRIDRDHDLSDARARGTIDGHEVTMTIGTGTLTVISRDLAERLGHPTHQRVTTSGEIVPMPTFMLGEVVLRDVEDGSRVLMVRDLEARTGRVPEGADVSLGGSFRARVRMGIRTPDTGTLWMTPESLGRLNDPGVR